MSTARDILLGSKRRRAMTLIGIMLVISVVAIEGACQVLGFFVLGKLDQAKLDPLHYYQPNDDPVLVCDLKHNCTVDVDGRRLKVNKFGFREDSDSTYDDKTRVAVFGDSVVFGTGVSQDETVSVQLQKLIDPAGERVRMLNCAMPGLSLEQFPAYLKKVQAAYKPGAVVYVLNPNDFVLRNTVYEGADNGLYRQYAHPFFKAPWMIRKAVYRAKKSNEVSPSTRWYKWTYEGTKGANLPRIAELKAACDASKTNFVVVFLPVRGWLDPADKEFAAIYSDIQQYLKSQGIAWFDPAPAFTAAGGAKGLMDDTDHFTPAGCAVMARGMEELVRKQAGIEAAAGNPPK